MTAGGRPPLGDAAEVLARIEQALADAVRVVRGLPPPAGDEGRSAVTAADLALDRALRRALPRGGEGWLSEESPDDGDRLRRRRVWVVDPLDGTREYVAGVPEWAISIGLVEDGRAVAGGIANPATGEVFLGAAGRGVTRNGAPAAPTARAELDGALVLASRSESARGEWEHCRGARFRVKAVGSVAYKLALVAAGLADATWTCSPKSEWDVAGGVALVLAGGGEARGPDGREPAFNRPSPRLRGLCASGAALAGAAWRAMASGASPGGPASAG
jgi:myo-inositol-1(or 4)-monophosphatase